MEQQETPDSSVTTLSTGIRYGLIGAVISVAIFVLFNVAGIDMTSGPWQYLGWIITVALIYFAHVYYKQNGSGFMSYGQGVGIAFWFALISSLISSVFTYIYIKFVDANFLEMIVDREITKMEEKGMTADQIDQAMPYIKMFTSAEAIFGFGLFFGILIAVIIGLLVTIFTQKKNPDFPV